MRIAIIKLRMFLSRLFWRDWQICIEDGEKFWVASFDPKKYKIDISKTPYDILTK